MFSYRLRGNLFSGLMRNKISICFLYNEKPEVFHQLKHFHSFRLDLRHFPNVNVQTAPAYPDLLVAVLDYADQDIYRTVLQRCSEKGDVRLFLHEQLPLPPSEFVKGLDVYLERLVPWVTPIVRYHDLNEVSHEIREWLKCRSGVVCF